MPRALRLLCALALLPAGAGGRACLAQLAPPPLPPLPISSSQSAAPAAPLHGPFRIAGRLVDSLDGHPLRRGSVALFDILSPNRREVGETEASADGVFAVADLPAGKFRVQASAPGYIAAPYDAHGQFGSAIVTGAGFDTEHLVFRLVPAAALHGRVTDEAGEPVQNAAITLFRENNDTGTRKITQFRNARTDDLGEYEITRLAPGTYFATARGTPWYATYPPSGASGNGFGIVPSVSPELNAVYPLTFYPEATDSGGAAPIVLKAGDRFHADFHLTPQPAVHLTMQTPGGSPETVRTFPMLQQKVFDTLQVVSEQRVQTTAAGQEVQGLAAGTYMLRQNGPNGVTGAARTVDLTRGSGSVEAAAPASYGAIKVSLAPAAAIPPATLPATLQLSLHPLDAAEETMQARPTARVKDGVAEFPNVEPGDYRLEPGNSRFHVDSVTEAGSTHAGARLHVTGAGQAVSVAVGAGNVTVTGFARVNGKGLGGAMIVLVPAGGDHGLDLYRRDQSDLDGSFEFANVTPGNYLLVAIDDGWSLEWGRPEVLTPYLLQALPVTVAANSTATLKLDEPIAVQPR